MSSGGVARGVGPRMRWFVRATAVAVGLANLRALVWLFGYSGEGASFLSIGLGVSFSDALQSVLLVLVAALAASELSLRRFRRDIVSEDYALRYTAAFRALCIGGALAGALLAGLWAVDGTMGANPPAGYFSDPANLLRALVGLFPVGFVGATVGGFFGFVQGTVLAFPLAAALGRFGKGGRPGEAHPGRPSGAVQQGRARA